MAENPSQVSEPAVAYGLKKDDKEQLKILLLSLLKEDDTFVENVKASLNRKTTKTKKSKELDYIELSKEDIPFEEMPFWKHYPNFPVFDATPYRISKEALKEVQKEWRDMPPAEEIIAQLTK
jgi:hypothetical protein